MTATLAGKKQQQQQTSVSLFVLHPTSQLCLMSLRPARAINSPSVMCSDFNPSSSLICSSPLQMKRRRRDVFRGPTARLCGDLPRSQNTPLLGLRLNIDSLLSQEACDELWGREGGAVINHSLSLCNQPNGRCP